MLRLVCPEYKMEWVGVTYRNDHYSLGATGGKESNPWLDLSEMRAIPGRPQQVDLVVSQRGAEGPAVCVVPGVWMHWGLLLIPWPPAPVTLAQMEHPTLQGSPKCCTGNRGAQNNNSLYLYIDTGFFNNAKLSGVLCRYTQYLEGPFSPYEKY